MTGIHPALLAAGTVGGAGALAAGVANFDGADYTAESYDSIRDDMRTLADGTAHPATNAAALEEPINRLDNRNDQWRLLGIGTGAAGATAVIGGATGLAARGSQLGKVAGYVGGVGALAAAALGLATWRHYADMDNATERMGQELLTVAKDVMAQPSTDSGTVSAPGTVSGPGTASPIALPLPVRPTAALLAAQARVDSIDEYAATIDKSESDGLGDDPAAVAVARARINTRLAAAIPLAGPVDWRTVAQEIDHDGNGSITFAERERIGVAAAHALAAWVQARPSSGEELPTWSSEGDELLARTQLLTQLIEKAPELYALLEEEAMATLPPGAPPLDLPSMALVLDSLVEDLDAAPTALTVSGG